MKYFPADLAILFGSDLIVLTWGISAYLIVHGITEAQRSGDATLFAVALGSGALGVGALFLAHMPLYRQNRFTCLGQRKLDVNHCRLYRIAYRFIALSIVLLLLVLLAVR